MGRRLRHANVPWVAGERGSKRAAIEARPGARESGPSAAARGADPSTRSHANEASRPSLLVVALRVLVRLAFHPSDGAAGDRHPLAPHGVARVLDVEEPSPASRPAAYQQGAARAHHEIATENPRWGAVRIQGELLALDYEVSAETVRCYRRKALRRPPSQSWRTFLANHRPQLWACDFFTVQTLTFKTLVRLLLHHAHAAAASCIST